MADKSKFPIWFLIFALVGAGILSALGFWQVQRLAWKEDLLARIDIVLENPDPEWVYLQDLEQIEVLKDQRPYFFKRVAIEGIGFHQYEEGTITLEQVGGFIRGQDVAVAPKTHKGKIGAHIYSPFVENDRVLWVKQGWVEAGQVFGAGNMYVAKQISGVLKYPPRPNVFTPDNSTESNEWFIADPKAMSGARGLDVEKTLPFILVRDDLDTASNMTYEAVDANLRNDHLQYAIFWFVMAGALLIIAGIKISKK